MFVYILALFRKLFFLFPPPERPGELACWLRCTYRTLCQIPRSETKNRVVISLKFRPLVTLVPLLCPYWDGGGRDSNSTPALRAMEIRSSSSFRNSKWRLGQSRTNLVTPCWYIALLLKYRSHFCDSHWLARPSREDQTLYGVTNETFYRFCAVPSFCKWPYSQ